MSGDLLQAAKGEPFVFFSADGTPFRPVTLPTPPSHTGSVLVTADADHFAIAATSTGVRPAGAEQIWQSPDGITWAPTPAPPADQSSPTAVGYLNGRLTLVSGYSATGPTVATLGDGGWTEAQLSKVMAALPAGSQVYGVGAAIGPFGIAVAVSITSDSTAPLGPSGYDLHAPVSRDGLTWSDEVLDQLAGTTIAEVPKIVVTGNRFIVTAQHPVPKDNPPAPETVLVATAR